MKQSKHTIFIPDFPDEGKYLVFNTRTQAEVVIDRELMEIIEGLPATDGRGASGEALTTLKKMGILVDDESDENKIIEEWFKKLKSDTSVVNATVLTTYACNFACPYCVEEGVKAPVHMTEDTANRSVSYILQKVKELSPQRLFLTFYGGEPLLNLKAIRTVAPGLRAFSEKTGLPFSFGMTTNGALLTPKVVEELKDYGLKGVKITLDGTRKYHDLKRPFKNGKGSFDIIMQNILYAAERIDVDIGGNFDDENAENVPVLLDYLKHLGLATKLHLVRFKPIMANLTDRDGLPASADLGCVFSEPVTARRMLDLRRAVLERGFKAEPGVGVNLCSVVMNSAVFIIDPEGKLFKCPALVGHRDFEVGDISSGETRGFVSEDLWKRCLECRYLPLCGDGCPYSAYLRYGDHTRLNCQKDFIEYLVNENLKLNYQLNRKKNR